VDAVTNYSSAGRIHLALVTETYAPEVNGVAMTLGRLVDGLLAANHRISIFRPGRSVANSPGQDNSLREFTMPGMPVPGYTALHFGFPAASRLYSYWCDDPPDVAYVATEGPLGWSAIRAAQRLGIPVVSGFHTNFHSYSKHYHLGWLQSFVLRYLRRLHNRTCFTLTPTHQLAQTLTDNGFDNVRVMQRGVDTRLFNPCRRSAELRSRWGCGENTIVCLYVGRIAAEKNIHEAVDTVCQLSPHIDIRFVLVGDGPLRNRLEHNHPEFIFCGERCGEDLAAHYASGDLLLFPSRTETFGNVVTEGMASGLAVVAYDEAAAHDFIDDWENGVLARDDGPHDFTGMTLRLCKQPKKLRRIGERACHSVQAHGWPLIVEQFESILNEAIDTQALTLACRDSRTGVRL
jgi:glycosyltransferase involved in cell wall biosynthesis